jgi:hypothetical protein
LAFFTKKRLLNFENSLWPRPFTLAFFEMVGRRRCSGFDIAPAIARAVISAVRPSWFGENEARAMLRVPHWGGQYSVSSRKRGREVAEVPSSKRPRTEEPGDEESSRAVVPIPPISMMVKRKGFTPNGTYGGKYVKKFKKAKASQAEKRGMSLLIQNGGVVTQNNAAAIGHTIALDRMLLSIAGAVLKKGFNRAGITIQNWEDSIPNSPAVTVKLYHRPTVGGTESSTLIGGGTLTTFINCAGLLRDEMRALGGSTQLTLLKVYAIDAASPDKYGSVPLSNAVIKFYGYSTIVLQNRTKATSASTDASTDLVSSNPLVIKNFRGKGNTLITRDETQANLQGDATTGVIWGSADPDANGLVSPHIYSNVTRQRNLYLNPGGVKKDVIKFSFNGKFTTLYDLCAQFFEQNTSSSVNSFRSKIGMFSHFECERLCNTRTLEAQIEIGFELNQTYSCVIVPRNSVGGSRYTIAGSSAISAPP